MDTQKVKLQSTMAIPAYSCVTASGELADSNNPAHEHHVIGVTEGQIEFGAGGGMWGDVTAFGTIYNQAWSWSAGGAIYLNSIGLSQTPPGAGFVQQVGWALTPQSMLVNIQ